MPTQSECDQVTKLSFGMLTIHSYGRISNCSIPSEVLIIRKMTVIVPIIRKMTVIVPIIRKMTVILEL